MMRDQWPRIYRDRADAKARVQRCVSTVATAQGLENWLIIYTAGRGPRDERPVGQNSILDNIRDLYVLASRAKQHLVIVAGYDYMMEHCRSWRPAASLFQREEQE